MGGLSETSFLAKTRKVSSDKEKTLNPLETETTQHVYLRVGEWALVHFEEHTEGKARPPEWF